MTRPNTSESKRLVFEPLIGEQRGGQVACNIHVKTLQRYARHKRVPGYQIGGHWYFRESELESRAAISDKFVLPSVPLELGATQHVQVGHGINSVGWS